MHKVPVSQGDLPPGGVLFSLRISAFLCVFAVNRLFAHIYRRGAEERRDTQRRIRIKTISELVNWTGGRLRVEFTFGATEAFTPR